MKVGDYVNIVDGVHDASMPKNRRDGLIVEIFSTTASRRTGRQLHEPDQVIVMFSNGVFLKFHVSQVEVLSEIG